MDTNEYGPGNRPPESGRDTGRWGQHVQQATVHIEQDVRRVIAYINDEVVPDIRRSGSQALRTAAAELQKLAQRMEDSRAGAPAEPSSNPPKETPRP